MIRETDKRILDVLRCSINGMTVSWGEALDETEWQELYRAAVKHNILPLVADALPSELPPNFAERMRKNILYQAEQTAELCLLLEYLYGQGLRPLVIKGPICRALYPEPEHRPSKDEDLLVDPAEFPRLHDALLAFGLEPVKPELDLRESFEVSYYAPGRRLYVEVHKALFTQDMPYLNRMNSCFRSAHSRAETQSICGVSIRTLDANDHLLYLILHALKHFLLSGVGIRQVCDIALFSEKNRDRISWGGLRRKLSELGALDFARALYDIIEKYLLTDRQLADYLAGWELAEIDSGPMLKDIMEGGLYGTATMSRLHSATMTLTAAEKQKGGGAAATMRAIFQPRKQLQGRYRYLEKAPYLLPVAWTHRVVRYGVELLRGDRRTNSALDSIRVGSERIRLLEQYRIIDAKK